MLLLVLFVVVVAAAEGFQNEEHAFTKTKLLKKQIFHERKILSSIR